MRVFVAGATGAIGRPLVHRLQKAGHDVAALVRDPANAAKLREQDIETHVADALDRDAVIAAVTAARPEVVVSQLTALPAAIDLRRYREAMAPTNRLRREATPHLVAGAQKAGARRVITQSISFLVAPEGPAVVDESARPFTDAPPAMREAVEAALDMERCVLDADGVEGIVLRYGFFYGPGTAYDVRGGSMAEEIRRRRFPLVGDAGGVSSFVHVDDAAAATVLALGDGPTGVFNVTDDDPAPLRAWLPEVAAILGAGRPLRAPRWVARLAAGPHGVHFATTLRGNRNAAFKDAYGWQPGHASWREGFAAEQAGGG